MLAIKRELGGAIALFFLVSLCTSRPHVTSKRSLIIKDYFNPLTYPTRALQFEKGEDGKYHPHSLDSKVEYALAENLEAKNAIVEEKAETADDDAAPLSQKDDPTSKKELTKKENAFPKKYPGDATVDSQPTKLVDGKDKISDSEMESEMEKKIGIEKLEGDSKESSALEEEVKHKYTIMSKPDGKDDKPYGGHFDSEEDLPASSMAKEKEGRITIGQIPLLLPPMVPHGIQMLMRPRHISFGALTLMPVPPAMHVSDRLPMPEADVIEEKSETSVIEDVATGDTVVEGTREVSKNHYDNPLALGLPLPLIPFQRILKEMAEEDKLDGDAESEVLDVMGRKMLLQKKVLKYPGVDNSNVYLRVMSVRPLEHVDPEVLKELDIEKEKEVEEKARFEPAIKEREEVDALEKELLNKKESPIEKEEDLSKNDEMLEKVPLESEILNVQETQINEQVIKTEDEMKKHSMDENSKKQEINKEIIMGEAKPEIIREEVMMETNLDNKDSHEATAKVEIKEEIAKTLKFDEVLKSIDMADKSEIEEILAPKVSSMEDYEHEIAEESSQPTKELASRDMLEEAAIEVEDAATEITESKEGLKTVESEMPINGDDESKQNGEELIESIDRVNELTVPFEKKDYDEIDGKKETKHTKDIFEFEAKNIKAEQKENNGRKR